MNHPDPDTRPALLRAAAHHVATGGAVYLEHYDTARMPADHDGQLGPVRALLRIIDTKGTWFRAQVHYQLDGRSWGQTFEAELLDDDALEQELARAGLHGHIRLTDTCIDATPLADR